MTKIMDAVMQLAGIALLSDDVQRKPQEAVFVATWDACLGALRDPAITPDARLNELATLCWRLVSSRTVSTVMIETVKQVSFAVVGTVENKPGIIILPKNWPVLFAKEPWMQLGAVVYAASQARDFWNNRLLGHAAEAERRGKAYEAILLRMAARDESAKWPFAQNAYQIEVTEEFADFPQDLVYEGLDFDLGRASALFSDFSRRGIVAPTGVKP